jgi:small conductance mechanosensitive channel
MRRLLLTFLLPLLFPDTGHGFVVPSSRQLAPARVLWKSTRSTPVLHAKNVNAAVKTAVVKKTIVKGTIVKGTIVKGRLYTAISKFFISPQRSWEVLQKLGGHILKDWGDLVLIALCIRAPLPLARNIYKRRSHPDMNEEQIERRFLLSKTRKIAQLTTEVGELFGLLFAAEMGVLLLEELGFQFVRLYPVHQWIAGIIASLWGARNLSELKYYVLSRANRRDISKSGGTVLINRFFDILIYVGTILAILDFLSVQTGFALRSLFGLSSVGTLVFSLASRELASEFLASLAIQGTNMYQEGDRILLADGTSGTVQKMGWLNTHVRRSDELVVRIPNTQISGTRMANISRTRLSAVKQSLTISYDDMDKLLQLIQDIQTEIRASCPTLIDDGSRSFLVSWTDFKEYSLEVVVDAHFRTKPLCDAYFEVRQDVLLAIARAAKKNNISFSYTNFIQSGIPLMST